MLRPSSITGLSIKTWMSRSPRSLASSTRSRNRAFRTALVPVLSVRYTAGGPPGPRIAERKSPPMSLIEPKIDDLLGQVDSKYTLVILAAKRARQINSYYTQLGEGIGEFVPPLVEGVDPGRKPLSIALEEISKSKIAYERVAEGWK